MLALALLSSACSATLDPAEVTERFWRAVVAGHAGKIKRYVTARDRAQIDPTQTLLPVSAYELGRIVIEAERASVATRVTLDGDQPITLDIETVLVLEDGEWRVDYEATVREISKGGDLARVIERIGALGDTLKQGIDQSVEEMKRTLPAIERELARLEAEIEQRVPELREHLSAIAKRIEEAFEAPPRERTPQEPKEAPPPGVIAL